MPWCGSLQVEDDSATFENLGNSGRFPVLDVKLLTYIDRVLTGELARSVKHYNIFSLLAPPSRIFKASHGPDVWMCFSKREITVSSISYSN